MKKLIVIAFLLIAQLVYSGVGTTSIDILKIPLGIKAQGMGGAYIAISDSIEGMDINPAGLSLMDDKEILFIHDMYLEDMFYDSIYYGQNLGDLGVIGGSIKFLNGGIITQTLETPDGRYLGEGEEKSAYNYLLGIGYGVKLEKIAYNEFTKNLSVGGNLKLTGEIIGNEYNNIGLSIDLGAIYTIVLQERDIFESRGEFVWNKIGFGIILKNLGTSFNGNITPINMSFGTYTQLNNLGIKNNRIRISLDTDYSIDNGLNIRTGLEYYQIIDIYRLAFRTGFNISLEEKEAQGYSLGAGLGFKFGDIEYEIEYVFIPFGELGSNHKFGLYLFF